MAKISKELILFFNNIIILISLVGCSLYKSDTVSKEAVSDNNREQLTIMHVDMNNDGVQQFFKETGEKLNIDITLVETPAYPDSRQARISTLLASGDSSVDIFTVNDEMISEFKYQGYIDILDTDVFSEDDRKGYPQEYLNCMIMESGMAYSIPYRMDVLSLWINEKWLKEAGVEDVSTKERLQKFLDYSWEKGRYPYGGSWEKTYAYNEVGEFINLFGGDYYDWSDPKTREAIIFMKELIDKGYSDSEQMLDQYDQMNQKFINGEYGMVLMFTGGMNTFLSAGVYGDEYIHMTELPDLGNRSTYIATWQYVINKASTNKDAAKKFLQYISSKEGSKRYAEITNTIPGRKDIIDEEDLDVTGFTEMKHYLNNTKLLARPIPRNSMTYIEDFGILFQKYITEEMDLDQYCDEVQTLIDRNM